MLFLVSSALLAYPTPVDFNGKALYWHGLSPQKPTLYYEVVGEEAGENFTTIIGLAAQKWSEVTQSFLRIAPAAAGDEAQITVHLQNQIEGGDFASGYALFDRYTKDRKPLHCSFYIHVSSSFSKYFIAKTILHEMGHCLGLAHSLIPQAIMSYSLDKNAFALDIDDQAVIARLYPKDGSGPKLAPGCGVQERNAKHPLWLSPAFWLLPLLVGFFV